MGKLLSIAVKRKKRGEMTLLDRASISRKSGVENDTRGRSKMRQVTIVSHESWKEACAVLDTDIPWTARRANILIEGIELKETIGRFLHIGDAVLEIINETTPCKVMDDAHLGLMDALRPRWRGGVLGKVIVEGQIEVGDDVSISTERS